MNADNCHQTVSAGKWTLNGYSLHQNMLLADQGLNWVLGWAKSVYLLLVQTVVLYPLSVYFPAGANWCILSIFIERFIYESVHWAYSNSIIQSTPSPVPQSDTGLFCGYSTEDLIKSKDRFLQDKTYFIGS